MNNDFKLNVELYRLGLFEHICFRDVVTNEPFAFHPKQIDALKLMNDGTTTYVGYGGSARGGKSALIACDCIFASYAYPEMVSLIGRKNLSILWQTTWQTLLRMLRNFGFVQDVDYSYNSQKNELVFANGSKIIAKNLEFKPSDREGTEYGSLEITRAYIDQSEHVDIKIVEKIGERAGSHFTTMKYNQIGKVFEAFNPSNSHTKQRYWLPYRDKCEKETRKFIRALPSDNPGKEAKEWVKQRIKDFQDGTMSYVEYQKQILGNFDFDDNSKALMKRENIVNIFSNMHVLKEVGRKYITIDAARKGKDSCVIVIWSNWTIIEIVTLKVSLITDIIDAVKKLKFKHSVGTSNIICDEDGVGGGVVDGLKCLGFINNSKALGDENYKNLKTQCYYLLSNLVNNNRIYIDCELESTIKEKIIIELEAVESRDPSDDSKLLINTKDDIKEKIGHSPDYSDAIMFRLYFYLIEKYSLKLYF